MLQFFKIAQANSLIPLFVILVAPEAITSTEMQTIYSVTQWVNQREHFSRTCTYTERISRYETHCLQCLSISTVSITAYETMVHIYVSSLQ